MTPTIPQMLTGDPEIGKKFLSGVSSDDTTLYELLAIAKKSPKFIKATGGLPDRWDAFMRSGDVEECISTVYGLSSTALASAAENVMEYDPATDTLNGGNVSMPATDADPDKLMFGLVIRPGDPRGIGSVTDATRKAVLKSHSKKSADIDTILADDMPADAAVSKFGKWAGALYGSDGKIDSSRVDRFIDAYMDSVEKLSPAENPLVRSAVMDAEDLVNEITGADGGSGMFGSAYSDSVKNRSDKEVVVSKGAFDPEKKTEQQFVFKDDVSHAMEYLERNNRPSSEADALFLLKSSRRTGSEYFPRFGTAVPATNTVMASMQMLSGTKESTWRTLYQVIYSSPRAKFDKDADTADAIRQSILDDFDHITKNEKHEVAGFDSTGKYQKKTRQTVYEVHFTDSEVAPATKKMDIVMHLLADTAYYVQDSDPENSGSTSFSQGVEGKDGDTMTDSLEKAATDAMEHGAIETQDAPVRKVINPAGIEKAFAAAAEIYREVPSIRRAPIFEENAELFEKYRPGEHALHRADTKDGRKRFAMSDEDVSFMAASVLQALLSGRSPSGIEFFDPSAVKLDRRAGLTYISDWGISPELGNVEDAFRNRMAELDATYSKGEKALFMLPAYLLKKMYGQKLASAINALVEFNERIAGVAVDMTETESDTNNVTEVMRDFAVVAKKEGEGKGLSGTDLRKFAEGEVSEKVEAMLSAFDPKVDVREVVLSIGETGDADTKWQIIVSAIPDVEKRIEVLRRKMNSIGEIMDADMDAIDELVSKSSTEMANEMDFIGSIKDGKTRMDERLSRYDIAMAAGLVPELVGAFYDSLCETDNFIPSVTGRIGANGDGLSEVVTNGKTYQYTYRVVEWVEALEDNEIVDKTGTTKPMGELVADFLDEHYGFSDIGETLSAVKSDKSCKKLKEFVGKVYDADPVSSDGKVHQLIYTGFGPEKERVSNKLDTDVETKAQSYRMARTLPRGVRKPIARREGFTRASIKDKYR